MRYVTDTDEPSTSPQHERRRVPRRPMKGGGMAVFSTGLGAGTLVRVDLVDASWTGIGVHSPVEVAPGASVSLVPDDPMWPRQTGIVIRCEPCPEGGFSIGLLSRQNRAVA
jgi:hypothetical protein